MSSQGHRLAVLRNDHLGDLLLTTGLARNLAAAGWMVDIICKPQWQPTLNHSPHATAYGFGEGGIPPVNQTFALAGWLRRRKYSHLLIPHKETALLKASLLSGIRKRWAQLGGIQARLTLHRCIPSRIRSHPRHLADIWMDFARHWQVPVDDGRPELFLNDQERVQSLQSVTHRFGTDAYYVVHPFHGRSSCNWPVQRYVELTLQIVRKTGLPVIITGSKAERELLTPFSEIFSHSKIWISCGQLNLREFFSVIGGAKKLLCSSTGALHVASALNVPSISIFCPHPSVGPDLWKSFAIDSKIVSPPRAYCPRFSSSAPSCRDCGLPEWPCVDELLSLI